MDKDIDGCKYLHAVKYFEPILQNNNKYYSRSFRFIMVSENLGISS